MIREINNEQVSGVRRNRENDQQRQRPRRVSLVESGNDRECGSMEHGDASFLFLYFYIYSQSAVLSASAALAVVKG